MPDNHLRKSLYYLAIIFCAFLLFGNCKNTSDERISPKDPFRSDNGNCNFYLDNKQDYLIHIGPDFQASRLELTFMVDKIVMEPNYQLRIETSDGLEIMTHRDYFNRDYFNSIEFTTERPLLRNTNDKTSIVLLDDYEDSVSRSLRKKRQQLTRECKRIILSSKFSDVKIEEGKIKEISTALWIDKSTLAKNDYVVFEIRNSSLAYRIESVRLHKEYGLSKKDLKKLLNEK